MNWRTKYDIENQNEIHKKWCKKTHGFTKLKIIWIFENTIKKSLTTIDMINDE